jgi:hypothetical protein
MFQMPMSSPQRIRIFGFFVAIVLDLPFFNEFEPHDSFDPCAEISFFRETWIC